MTGRWLSEHRRLLAATIGPALLLAAALVALGGGSSAAQRSRLARPLPSPPALVAGRGELAAERAQVKHLQTLTSTQSAEIASLKAQLRALRHPHRHPHPDRHRYRRR